MAELVIAGTLGAAFNVFSKAMQQLLPPMNNIEQRAETDHVNSSAYGRQIPLVFGNYNRLAGSLIWTTGVQTTKRTRKKTNGIAPSTYTVTYQYRASMAFAIGEPITNLSRIWANGKVIFEQNSVSVIPDAGQYFAGGNGSPFASIRVYPGSFSQNPDPTIEAALGPGNVTAYRGISYVVITSMDVKNFGLGMPNLEFDIDGGAATTGSIVNTICQRAGLASDEYSIGADVNDTVDGFVISRQADAISATEPLRKAFAFDVAEHSGTIRFVARGRHIAAAIEAIDAGARQPGGSSVQAAIETQREADFELPKSATLTYIDRSRDFQENTQQSFRSEGDAKSNLNVNLAVTISSSLARQIVDRLLWEPWTARNTAPLLLSNKYEFLKPCDVITIPVAGAMSPFRIEKRTRGANGIIELELVAEDPFIYDGAITAEEAEIPENVAETTGDTFVYVYNAPIMTSSDAAAAFSWAADSASGSWEGGEIMRAGAVGGEFTTMGEFNVRNTTGTVATATPAAPTADAWDRSTVITVVLLYASHELESLSELDVLNGGNTAWIGAADGSHGEVIQFATATLIDSSPKTYELTDLLRGRRGTEHEMSLHGANEIFALYEGGIMQTTDLTSSDWDREREYKGVSILQDETDVVTTQAFTNLGEKAKPRSPVHGRGSRDSSNNLTITWFRRTRHFSPGIGYGSVALDEPTESYQIDVYDGATVVRTITATTPTASYTAAEQTTDGLTPGDPVDIRIYQISSTRGRGHAGVFTV